MRQAVVLAVMVAVLAAPISGQASSTTVTIAVPPTQVLDGTTTHTLLSGTPRPGRLLVKSNIPWVLRAYVEGATSVVWRPSGAVGWMALASGEMLRSGGRGVHEVAYEIRAAAPAVVRFALTPVP